MEGHPYKDSKVELRRFFMINLDLLCIADLDGRFIKVNKSWESILGYSSSELEKSRFLDFVHPEDLQATLDAMATLGQGDQVLNFINRYRRKDGSYSYIEWRSQPCGDLIYAAARDITDKISIQNMLKEKEARQQAALERFQKLFDSNPTMMSVRNFHDGQFIDVNGSFLEKMGYAKEEIIGKNSLQLNMFVDPQQYRDTFEALKKHGRIRNMEVKIRKKDGKQFTGLFSGEIIDNQVEKLILTVMVDISEKHDIEQALKQQTALLAGLLDSMPDIVFFKDLKGRYLGCNPEFSRYVGADREFIVGKTDHEIFSKENADVFRSLDMDMLKTGKAQHNEEWVVYPGGRRVLLDTLKVPLNDTGGNTIGVLGISRDITTRKVAEDKLIENERLMSAVAMSIKELLDNRDYHRAAEICFQLLGEATHSNRIALFQCHYEASRIMALSQTLDWKSDGDMITAQGFHQDLPYAKMEELMAPLLEGKTYSGLVRDIRNPVLREMFSRQHIRSLVLLPVAVKSRLWGFMSFIKTEYERVWTDAEFSALSSFAGSFGKAVERRETEQELEKARLAAESANVMKSRFLANMSHEIRTPMNGIFGFLELLKRSGLSPDQEGYVQEAQAASDMLLFLINDILDLSKIEAGKMIIEQTPFNIRSMVEETVSLSVPKATEKRLDITSLISREVPEEAVGDPSRIKQILNNLVSNAVKFTECGDILITVQSRDRMDNSADMIFTIRDTGIGINQEDLSRLFKPFTQADASTTRKYGGTGLGLTISRELARLMGGDIQVQSTPGEGTTFTLTLNLKLSDVIEKTTGIFEDSPRNILVVSDNMNVRMVIRSYLEETGCQVAEVENGEKALSAILSRSGSGSGLDAAIVDSRMDDMDPYHLMTVMKTIPSSKDTKLILLATADRKGEASEAVDRGFSGFLTLPVRHNELIRCLQSAIHASDASAQQPDSPLEKPENNHAAREQLKILLCEDNEMNRRIVSAILKQHGYGCDIAVDGDKAVAMVGKKAYDIIFMDCQMPVMDGYEATARIRELEAGRRHTPIIAMTANAMEGDRNKCLEAGMDDYISKPIQLETVIRMIHEYGQAQGSNLTAQKLQTLSSQKDACLESFIQEIGLDRETATEIFNDFLGRLPGIIGDIDKTLASGDLQRLATQAHKLKGSSGNLRIKALQELCMALEESAVHQDVTRCESLMAAVKDFSLK